MRAFTSCFLTISLEMFRFPAISPSVLSPFPSSPYLCLITRLSFGFRESSYEQINRKTARTIKQLQKSANDMIHCIFSLWLSANKCFYIDCPLLMLYKCMHPLPRNWIMTAIESDIYGERDSYNTNAFVYRTLRAKRYQDKKISISIHLKLVTDKLMTKYQLKYYEDFFWL